MSNSPTYQRSVMVLADLDLRTEIVQPLSDRMERPRIMDPKHWPTARTIAQDLDYTEELTDEALGILLHLGFAEESAGRFCITAQGEDYLIGAPRR